MKFVQLIEYNIANFFLKNDTKNMMETLFPDDFLKNKS